ncbi:MAG: tRNA 5-methoxyuridine(34)/uridine 5-oxyacetic acid(34) synthase CmoB [Woeseiaceae bacterium]
MLQYDRLWQYLTDIGVGDWRSRIEALLHLRLSRAGHGDFIEWQETLAGLAEAAPDDETQIRKLLLSLSPWRKGPFDVAGIHIDAEWRSDRKWERLADGIEPLQDRNVLDVGCGNGYYARRMCDAGAQSVIGVDPTLLYVVQHLAIDHFIPQDNLFVLPLRSDELPQGARAFDTCFSMGVLYHQRSPLLHLQQLRSFLRRSGELVLETLYVPGEESFACTPADRYARMRNVWLLPTIAELTTWLRRSGFKNIDIVDQSVTTVEEQRSTEWMTFDSLDKALDESDPDRTVEGWPAPRRVVIVANAP